MIDNKHINYKSNKQNIPKNIKKSKKKKGKVNKTSLSRLIDTFGVKKGLNIWRENYKKINKTEASMCQIGAALIQSVSK